MLVQSNRCPHVYHLPQAGTIHDKLLDPGWYWFDEAELLGNETPCISEDDAIEALNRYADHLNSGV